MIDVNKYQKIWKKMMMKIVKVGALKEVSACLEYNRIQTR